MNKQMEYTVKIITNGTINTTALKDHSSAFDAVVSAEVTNFRPVPKPKAPKAAPKP